MSGDNDVRAAHAGAGGAAFPHTGDHQLYPETGMTLRDYFAGEVLPALAAGPAAQLICDRDPRYNTNNFAEVVALNAYEFAEAMLRARSA